MVAPSLRPIRAKSPSSNAFSLFRSLRNAGIDASFPAHLGRRFQRRVPARLLPPLLCPAILGEVQSTRAMGE